MELAELSRRAMEIRARFAAQESARTGRPWSRAEIAQGFVGDVGDLMKLLMAKDGRRPATDLDAKLAHELADCLWSILVLARLCDVDLEAAFLKTMTELEARLTVPPPGG
jgi:NTP pyrophosphatase (non-canonical NTP hydrolase)